MYVNPISKSFDAAFGVRTSNPFDSINRDHFGLYAFRVVTCPRENVYFVNGNFLGF